MRNIAMKEAVVRGMDAVFDKPENADIAELERVVHWKVYSEKGGMMKEIRMFQKVDDLEDKPWKHDKI